MWIDAHMHLFDRETLSYPWLSTVEGLNRDFHPADLGTDRDLLTGVVIVEAGRTDAQWLAEVVWVESLAADPSSRILGMVAHAQLEDPARCAEQLAELTQHPLVVGIRRNLQDEPPGFALAEDFVTGVAALATYSYPFDLCVRHGQLREVTALAARLPDVAFVLDHCGKPPVASGALQPWRADLARLAELPNVVCKLSGLATEADHRSWSDDNVLPYLRHAVQVFGAERCLFGGDWPVATIATTYRRWLTVLTRLMDGWPTADVTAVAAGTATRIYRLPAPPSTP